MIATGGRRPPSGQVTRTSVNPAARHVAANVSAWSSVQPWLACPVAPGRARLHVEVEVANFYPTLAFRFGRWFYANTQSRIHVIVTHAFLRSLARLNLAESQVGALEGVEDVFDPGTVIRT